MWPHYGTVICWCTGMTVIGDCCNRYNGVQGFVESNYRMILEAAGRDALRALLLMLMANNCLNPSEVARLLRIFDSLAGSERMTSMVAINQ